MKLDEWALYLLECEQDVWYVGITGCLPRRMWQHWNGQGSRVTQRHKPIGATVITVCSSLEEAKRKENELTAQLREIGLNAFGGGFNEGNRDAECDSRGYRKQKRPKATPNNVRGGEWYEVDGDGGAVYRRELT